MWEIETTSRPKSARAREIDAVSRSRRSDRTLACGRDGQGSGRRRPHGQVTLLDATSFAVWAGCRAPGKEPENLCAPSLAFSPDGHELAVGSQQGTISLWSVSQPGATAGFACISPGIADGSTTWSTTHRAAGWPARVSTRSSKSGTLKSSIASCCGCKLAD